MLIASDWFMTHASAEWVAASSGDDEGGSFGLVFLLSGFIFYAVIYFTYRNVDKRHKHESETEATLHNMEAHDQFLEKRTGLSQREMAGANNNDVRGAQRKFF